MIMHNETKHYLKKNDKSAVSLKRNKSRDRNTIANKKIRHIKGHHFANKNKNKNKKQGPCPKTGGKILSG